MREMRIDWDKVRKRMIDRKVSSLAQLSAATGINKNTLSKKNDSFFSTTVNRLADYLGCDPLDIVMSVVVPDEVEQPATPAPTPTADAMREERRAKLLEQARGRGAQ